MKHYALIVAGGSGVRMNTEVPKQFLPVAGVPILMRTLKRFAAYNRDLELIVVLPEPQIAYWQHLCQKHQFTLDHAIVAGGETRFHSVQNGLAAIAGEGVVAVHDGVRPFVGIETIERTFRAAEASGAAIPVVALVDSIRARQGNRFVAANRADYLLVQTPQVFQAHLLRRAYEQPYSPLFTDDASVVEALGEEVRLVDGNRENLKITTSFDLKVAEALVQNEQTGA